VSSARHAASQPGFEVRNRQARRDSAATHGRHRPDAASGKTTTLEALISRANLPAIAFVTKRGDRSFDSARRVPPTSASVASVLEATMRETLKIERARTMRASKGARTLADVHRTVRKLLVKAKDLSADVYLTLDVYLEIVVPRMRDPPRSGE
jgi:hypothetical protein